MYVCNESDPGWVDRSMNTSVGAYMEMESEEKDPAPMDIGADDHSPLTVTSRVLYMLGDIAAGPAYRFTQWLELVRKRHHSRGGEQVDVVAKEVPPLPSLWHRLGSATSTDIDSPSFSWDALSSLHHMEGNTSCDQTDSLEVTVNSGGVVFFALFHHSDTQSAAVLKFSSSRMATQSERLGYEFANRLGVPTPQARVIHNCSPEWPRIKEATIRARDAAASPSDQVTCSELLEALDLSRCLFLMTYVHGSPLLESSRAFEPGETSERTAAALGRVLMLDLVIRNEDRLPCPPLRWRGNSANLLMALKITSPLDSPLDSPRPRTTPTRFLNKERRATSVMLPQLSELSDITDSPKSSESVNSRSRLSDGSAACCDLFRIVAIDSGVPRRPPAGKRANDHSTYPKLVELLLNTPDYASSLLFDITAGKLGCPSLQDTDNVGETTPDMVSVVQDFRNGFRAALRDLQGFHIFLLTLHQKLDNLLRLFMNIIGKTSSTESDKEDSSLPESPSQGNSHCTSPPTKERFVNDNHLDYSDSEQRSAPRSSFSASKENSESNSPISRDNWHGRLCKGSGEHLRNLRLTAKLRDFHKFAKVDAELNKELEQWNEMLRNEAVKLCQENNFTSGFFEGSDNNCVIDAYELKIRLEHILERIALISEAANTERPSTITSSLFIGGALAARSVFTLQRLGITHILCLCSNEIGQSDSQHHDLFEYRNFSISDQEDANISSIFEEASDFIQEVEQIGGKVLVHCFEGKSRSATVVIAYLMLKKNYRLAEAWNLLKKGHRRAQPNDGFAKLLQNLDKKVYGSVSMEWLQRKPMIKVCPICGSNAGLSSSSLKLHLQKSHKKLSSGSVDTAMTLEIQKALAALNINRRDDPLP